MLDALIRMLGYALFISAVQNIIFSGALGIDESIRSAKKPRYLLTYGFWVTFFSLGLSVISHYVLPVTEEKFGLSMTQDYLVCVIILTLIYLISALFCKFILRADRKYMNSLGMCAFNSLVLSLPFIAKSSLASAVGYALGAGAAYILSVLIIRAGMRHIHANPHIPSIFKGTPALFIYICLVALALSCVSSGASFN